MPINGRAKGAAGEREAAKWLQQQFKLEHCPERNLEQVRRGGYDLIGFPPFAIEVKRCEMRSLRTWWLQVAVACDKGDVPVVMYRANRQPWRFLVSAREIGLDTGFIMLEEREFKLWVQAQLN